MEAGADARAVDHHGNTVLHRPKDAASVRMLVAAGVDARAVGAWGYTPLHVAVRHQAAPEVLEELIAAGVDVDAYDDRHTTALDTAIERALPAGRWRRPRGRHRQPRHRAAVHSGAAGNSEEHDQNEYGGAQAVV